MKKEEKRKMLEMVEKEYGLGKLFLVFRDGRLCALEFGDPGPGKLEALHHRFGERELRPGPGNPAILDRLDAYFAGDLRAIDPHVLAVDLRDPLRRFDAGDLGCEVLVEHLVSDLAEHFEVALTMNLSSLPAQPRHPERDFPTELTVERRCHHRHRIRLSPVCRWLTWAARC